MKSPSLFRPAVVSLLICLLLPAFAVHGGIARPHAAELQAPPAEQSPSESLSADMQVRLALARCSLIYGELFLRRNAFPPLEEVAKKAAAQDVGDTSYTMRYTPLPESGSIRATASKGDEQASGMINLKQLPVP